MGDSNPVITEFIDHYRQKYDFYNHLSSLVAEQLRSELARRGIRAIVSSRAKDPAKLREKLIKRSTREKDPKTYHFPRDIETDIVDLAGVRVALYFPGDTDKVGDVISDIFEQIEPVKKFPEKGQDPLSKGLLGYIADHYRIRLLRHRLQSSLRRYSDTRVEIQVASVLMHAWAEIDHDLRYKPHHGNPSQDELATLDEVNGLVLTGEIALERLQRLIEARVGVPDSHFRDSYELQEFLSTKLTNLSSGSIGRVNYLFELIRSAQIDTPRDLEPYFAAVNGENTGGPLADQLIDAITSEDPKRYQLFTSILGAERDGERHDSRQNEFDTVIGTFLNRWIALEQTLRNLTGNGLPMFAVREVQSHPAEFGLNSADAESIGSIRTIRNSLVHGQGIFSTAELKQATEKVNELLTRLQKKSGRGTGTAHRNRRKLPHTPERTGVKDDKHG